MYVKKKYRRLLDLTDEQFTIPSSFQRFIDEKEDLHNLVIKSKGGKCWCTCCHHSFVSQTKVNGFIKCPNCKNKLLVKSDRLHRYTFKDCLQLLDKIEDKFVLRSFELYSTYYNNEVEHKITEFMRTIIDENEAFDFVSNQVHNHMGYMYVAHYQTRTSWRGRNFRWAYRDIVGMVCPYNIKSLLKDTELRYSQLDKFISKKNDYLDFIKYFTSIACRPSFEFLVKMKLYNLAMDAYEFRTGKNFEEIFGVSKSFYPFIKKHDLTYEQLKVLRLIKKEDIRLINKLVHFNNLQELSRYVNLEEAYYKVLKTKSNREYEYLDYLRTCIQLGYDMKDKKILYPKDLMKEHDKVMDLIEVVKNEANDRLIKERLETLNKNIYQNDKYIVYPASSSESLIRESRLQHNCVKSYINRYALAETDIYFMREINDVDKPLVTVEVKDKDIVQARIKYNDDPNEEQLKFLDLWKTKILNNAVA